MSQKYWKNQSTKPHNSSSRWDKTIGCERTCFWEKIKPFHICFFLMTLILPKPHLLQWIRRILTLQKSTFLGSIFAPSCSLLSPKHCFLQWISMILEVSLLSSRTHLKAHQNPPEPARTHQNPPKPTNGRPTQRHPGGPDAAAAPAAPWHTKCSVIRIMATQKHTARWAMSFSSIRSRKA